MKEITLDTELRYEKQIESVKTDLRKAVADFFRNLHDWIIFEDEELAQYPDMEKDALNFKPIIQSMYTKLSQMIGFVEALDFLQGEYGKHLKVLDSEIHDEKFSDDGKVVPELAGYL